MYQKHKKKTSKKTSLNKNTATKRWIHPTCWAFKPLIYTYKHKYKTKVNKKNIKNMP